MNFALILKDISCSFLQLLQSNLNFHYLNGFLLSFQDIHPLVYNPPLIPTSCWWTSYYYYSIVNLNHLCLEPYFDVIYILNYHYCSNDKSFIDHYCLMKCLITFDFRSHYFKCLLIDCFHPYFSHFSFIKQIYFEKFSFLPYFPILYYYCKHFEFDPYNSRMIYFKIVNLNPKYFNCFCVLFCWSYY